MAQETEAERASEPPGMPRLPPLTPHLTIAGAAAAIEFYDKAFGARLITRQDTPDGKVLHAMLGFPNGGVLMLCDDFPEMGKSRSPKTLGGSPVTIHLELTDVDAVWKQAVAAGAEVTTQLAEQFWGARYGTLRDPFGHSWSLATQVRQPSQAERDEAAKKFGKG
jgi:PhnB protein